MTAKQSTARLLLYASIAGLTPVASNWEQMAGATLFQWGGLLLQSTITALIAVRAYVDTTPTRIDQTP